MSHLRLHARLPVRHDVVLAGRLRQDRGHVAPRALLIITIMLMVTIIIILVTLTIKTVRT